MRLHTAHRILIGSFVAFAIFFAVVKLNAWRAGAGVTELIMAGISAAVAVGFAVYLARLPAPGA